MATKTSNNRRHQNDDFLTLKELLALCLNRWKWFVASLIISMALGVYHLLSTPSIYSRTISIIVKDGNNGSDANQQLEELGIDMTSSNINDEIVAVHSPTVILETVKRLNLNISYFRPGMFKDTPLYAETLPVEVAFHDLNENDRASFTIQLVPGGKAKLSEFISRKGESNKTVSVKVGEKCKTPIGDVTITPTLYYAKEASGLIKVYHNGVTPTAKRYNGAITAQLQEKNSNIIDVRCMDTNIARAENILNTVINIYNENWVNNRNQISIATNEFIKERLSVIEQELSNVDSDISSFKSSHSMPDVSAAASQAMSQATATSNQGMELSNQQYMARYIRGYITGDQHTNELLPANSGINNPYIEKQITDYNNAQLQRNNLLAISSAQNPLVKDLDRDLTTMRQAIITSLDNELTKLNTQQRSVQASHGQAIAQMTANPTQAKYLLSVERQQKVKESLYLFLLQKREENELTQAFTAYNTRIIAAPNGSDSPTSPKRNNVLLIAFALGLLIPAAIVFIIESTNTAIRGRKDLEGLNIPFIGEVPLWRRKLHWWQRRKAIEKKDVRVAVKPKSRNIINEAFRIVRTNLDFIASTDNDNTLEPNIKYAKIVMLTSFNPGSGKTFICANLGASVSISNKRALCIDLDLRRSSLSKYAPDVEHGLTDYLGGNIDNYQSIICHNDDSGLDIIPVGTIPPNPTELLLSNRMKQMLKELRLQYDYIFLDCPPIDIVADASIMSKEADITIFIVRSTLMQKNMLPELERYYEEKKFNNLTILLNGTDINSQYGYNRYGYGYGRSGYGYGYGYGYGNNKD